MLKIFDLTVKDKPSRGEIGGKAYGLMQAKRYGFSVPNGFVLPIPFFDSWFCTIRSSLEWEQYVKDPTPVVCSDLKEKVQELCFDPEQKSAVDSYFKKSGFDGLLAVRSSTPDEDSEDISFAGMYHSCLDVERKDLEKAVALTLSSLFDYRVVSYRLKNGLDVTESGMAVIVQRQLNSELSGVGFSINPENNCYDEIMINAIAGPGEALMSGALTPDCYIAEKYKGYLLRKNLADIYNESHMDDELILAVASLVRECEDAFEYPVDIEWSYEEGNLYLLQVRPITTYFPLFEEMLSRQGEPRTLYVDVMQTSQGLDRQISVLGLDLYDMAMQRVMAQGIMPSTEGGYLLNLHGKQYFNVSNMLRGMGKSLTIRTAGDQDYAVRQHKEEITATYMTKDKTPAMKKARKAMIRVALRDIPKLAGTFLRPTHQLERYELLTEQILKDIRELSGEECFTSTVKKGFALLEPITEHAATYVPGQLALERIKRIFRGKDLEEDIAALGIALPSNPTTAMTRSLYALASNPEMSKTGDAGEFVRRIKNRDFDDSFLLKIDEYLAKYGGRGFYEIDVASERAGDDYTLLFRQMGDISVGDNALQRAEDKKKLAVEKLSQIAVSKGKGEAFRKNLERYEKLFGLRETPKYVVSMLLGRLHQLALVMGRRWVAEGRLDEEKQVFDLHLEQIKSAEREPGLALRPMIQINMEPYLCMKNVKHWPITFDSRGKTINPVPEIAEGGMKGQSISLGVVRGRAKVLIGPYEKPLLSGEILVTHAMEPSWMVILLNATGVVLEVGGNLQHGAIIAREFGIPCVSGLRRATTLIHDGDLVEVDGNNGLVRILEKSEIDND